MWIFPLEIPQAEYMLPGLWGKSSGYRLSIMGLSSLWGPLSHTTAKPKVPWTLALQWIHPLRVSTWEQSQPQGNIHTDTDSKSKRPTLRSRNVDPTLGGCIQMAPVGTEACLSQIHPHCY